MRQSRPAIDDENVLFVNALECPFAQRVWIALEEEDTVKYRREDIDLRDQATGQYTPESRPQWVKELNPDGKVPILALRTADGRIRSIYESLVCNELIEDISTGAHLRPSDVWTRARARMVVAQFDSRFLPAFYRLLLRQDTDSQKQAAGELEEACLWLEGQCSASGPYFLGTEFSLVDCALAPFFLRLPLLHHYRGIQLPKDCERLAAWWKHVSKRPSVCKICISGKPGLDYLDYLVWVYFRYADGTARSTSAADYR